jgi:L,D-transpeptidase catalytic domain/Putative peptidoglycan binding domain/Sporulation and spore germination
MPGPRQVWVALAVAVVALAAPGCGGGDEPETTAAPEPTAADPAETAAEPNEDAPTETATAAAVELYFTSGEQFRRVERRLPAGGSDVETAAEELIAGPTKGERNQRVAAQTQIPADAEVEAVDVADGTATVRVSREFLSGIPAEASARTPAQQDELDARLGQVTYTLTQFPRVEEAKVVSGGIGVEPGRDRKDYAKPSRPPDDEPRARGAQSAETRSIQRRLARLGYLPKSAVDGVAGYRTQQAVIAFQSWEGLARDGIVGPITRAALADARRPRPRGSGDEKRIEVFRDRGVALVVQNGRTKRAIHVSTGAPGTATPAGTFSVFRKEKMSWSVPFQQWLPLASYFFQGIAFHEYASVPTYPASHGCVRVPEPEARWLYRFADIGRKVVVY